MLLAFALGSLASCSALFGQVAESANAGGVSVWVGAGVFGYYLQYGEVKNLGLTGYFDTDSIRRFGVEGEGRLLEYHKTANIHAGTYLAGPRYHINIGRFQPCLKVSLV